MTILTKNKLFLLPIIAPLFLASCATATLPKSNALLETESIYEKISNDSNIRQNAASKLKEANDVLEAATYAKTEEEMAHLVYTSNNKIKTAIETAKAEIFKKRVSEIRDIQTKLQNEHFRKKMN